jgi:hypothetical protein
MAVVFCGPKLIKIDALIILFCSSISLNGLCCSALLFLNTARWIATRVLKRWQRACPRASRKKQERM